MEAWTPAEDKMVHHHWESREASRIQEEEAFQGTLGAPFRALEMEDQGSQGEESPDIRLLAGA